MIIRYNDKNVRKQFFCLRHVIKWHTWWVEGITHKVIGMFFYRISSGLLRTRINQFGRCQHPLDAVSFSCSIVNKHYYVRTCTPYWSSSRRLLRLEIDSKNNRGYRSECQWCTRSRLCSFRYILSYDTVLNVIRTNRESFRFQQCRQKKKKNHRERDGSWTELVFPGGIS